MNKRERFLQRINLTYAAYNDAAEAGLPAPTDAAIHALCGYSCTSGAAAVRTALMRADRITVEKIPGGLQITLTETGKSIFLVRNPGRWRKPNYTINPTRQAHSIARGAERSLRFSKKGERHMQEPTLTTCNDPKLLKLLREFSG